MKEDFLLEIGTEEMPAGWLEGVATQLKDKIYKICGSPSSEMFYTPRRIAVLIKNVYTDQKDMYMEITGPPKEIALTKDGNWSESALGFARAHGVSGRELKLKQKGKKEVLCCEKLIKGKRTLNILKSSLPALISEIEFPKSMKWESSGVRFGRPIRWIVALFGETIIPFEVAGIKSGRKSHGLRFSPQITIKSPSSYEECLKLNGIIANPKRRKEFIEEEELKLLEGKELSLQGAERRESSIIALLEEVVNLVECPKVILCKFDERYLTLPREIITAAMETHQRYFPLNNSDGILSHHFIVVVNTKEGDIGEIRKGHERVLRARLEDAEFYYKEDMKFPLENRVDELKGVTWQEGLGTLYDKTERLIELSIYIAEKYIPKELYVDLEALEKAARLCKVDLITNMIKDGKEFTQLEGLYGSILAKEQQLESKVVLAIERHSSPVFPRLPTEAVGVALAIADRIDTIIGAFILGKIPTGSKDPLGIRRVGNELISIIIENLLHIPLKELIEKSVIEYSRQQDNKEKEVIEFLVDRLFRRYLGEKDVRYDIIGAVLEIPNDDLVDLYAMAKALNELKGKEDFITLVRLAKRVRNILNKSQISNLKSQALKEPEEKDLYNALIFGKKDFENHIREKDYGSALTWLLNLAPLINNFFDKVLVMAPESEIRENRLALLQYLHSFFQKIADFSEIEE